MLPRPSTSDLAARLSRSPDPVSQALARAAAVGAAQERRLGSTTPLPFDDSPSGPTPAEVRRLAPAPLYVDPRALR